MAAARDGEEPPPELYLHWSCERYHSLPEDGGLYDQDCITMIRMQSLSSIYSAVMRYVNSSGKEIHGLTESERRVLRMLKDMKLMFV